MPQPEYAMHCEPLSTALQMMDVQALIDQVDDPWPTRPSSRLVRSWCDRGHAGRVPLAQTRRADEFFFVLDGLFRIDLDGADTIELGSRQAFANPAGMATPPSAAPY
ncbi:hypothetical protein ACRYCC_42700 [Actinomadura scrupuli]|uniref:hypothetical protein n=1 Tax=Actinomadura scrupuli TaxID=559629 RepID=UPI003D951CBC